MQQVLSGQMTDDVVVYTIVYTSECRRADLVQE